MLPDVYAMGCDGQCLLPFVPDGASVAFSKLETPGAGDFACIWLRPEIVKPGHHQGILKRLVLGIPDWVKFPWTDNPQSDVVPIIIAEQFNPAGQYRIRCSDVLAVHKALGYVGAGAKIGGSINERDLQPFAKGHPAAKQAKRKD